MSLKSKSLVAYVIGLESRYRGAELEAQLQGVGLPMRRAPGVEHELDGILIEELADQDAAEVMMRRPLSPGEIGCALAHMQAYKMFLETDDYWAIVLEDDARLARGAEDLVALAERVPSDPEIVLLYGRGLVAAGAGDPLQIGTRRALTTVPQAAVAYMINRPAAEHILSASAMVVSPADWPRRSAFAIDYACVYPFIFAPNNSGEGAGSTITGRDKRRRSIVARAGGRLSVIAHIRWFAHRHAYGAYRVYLFEELVTPLTRLLSNRLATPRYSYLVSANAELPQVGAFAGRWITRLGRLPRKGAKP